MNISKSLKTVTTTLTLATLVACSSGGSCPPNLPAQEAGKLVFVAPSILPSLANKTGVNYMGVYNPSTTSISGISYDVGQQVGAGSSIVLDTASAKTCASIAAQSSCFLKFSVPESTIAGGAVVTASSSSGAEAATPLAVGVQQVAYTESANANGVGLYFYPKAQYSANGVPFILVTAVVQSPNVGNINTIQLVDESGNVISDQTVISNNSGVGKAALQMGDVVEISLPLPQGVDLTQKFKVQVSNQGLLSSTLNTLASKLNLQNLQAAPNSSIGTTIYSLSTQGNNINLQFTPNQVYLTQTNPIQYGYLYNIGDLTASQINVTSASSNVKVTAADTILNEQRVIKVTYELINTSVAATSNLVTVTANNPAGQTQTSTAGTNQNVNPLPVPTPSPTPTPTPSPTQGPGPTPQSISAQLSSTNNGVVTINGVANSMTFYIVFRLTGSGAATITPTLPTGMEFVGSTSCTVSSPSNTQCYIEVRNQNSAIGTSSISYSATGITAPAASTVETITFWTKISGGANQPDGWGYYGPYGVIDTSMMTLSDSNGYVWGYSNESWTQLSGLAGQPNITYPDVNNASRSATPNSLITSSSSDSNYLWSYQNGTWSQLTHSGVNPAGVSGISVNSELNNLFIVDNALLYLWYFNNGAWQQLTGSGISGAPSQTCLILGKTSPSSLLVIDGNCGGPDQIWNYLNETWTQLTTGSAADATQPGGNANNKYWTSERATVTSNQVPAVLNYATPESMIVSSPANDLWIYKNSAWINLTGAAYATKPTAIGGVWGNQSVESMVVTDSSNNLWVFKNNSWIQLTTGTASASQPEGIFYVSINSTPNNIWAVAADNLIWFYNGSTWSNFSAATSSTTNFAFILGSPNSNSLVALDSSNQLWIYNGEWLQTTGLSSDQPTDATNTAYSFNAASYSQISPSQVVVFDSTSPSNIWIGKGFKTN